MIRRTAYALWSALSLASALHCAALAHDLSGDLRAVFLTLSATNAVAAGVVAWWTVRPNTSEEN